MKGAARWPQLRELVTAAAGIGGLEVWLFGSAARTASPRDIDVLVIYDDADAVDALRASNDWGSCEPPIDMIAMTVEEEADYQFIAGTGATLISVG